MKTIARLCLGMALAGLLAPGAMAHAKLISADPAAGGEAKAGVGKLRITFSEAIAAKLSGATLADSAGKPVAAVPAVVDPADPKALLIATKAPLTAGVYTVAWRAVASDDGHKTTGVYTFTVK